MLSRFIEAALRRARYELLPDDGTFYGEIPGLAGVWANAGTLEGCRDELIEVIEDWILVRIARGLPVPPLDGIELAVRPEA